VYDVADLRQLMNAALLTSNDAELIEVLQVARDEMPEAIKTLQRALEREVAVGSAPTVEGKEPGVGLGVGVAVSGAGSVAAMSAVGALVQAQGIEEPMEDEQKLERKGTVASKGSGGSSGMTGKDLLDREFIESGLDALRRMSHATDTSLPSWTITRFVSSSALVLSFIDNS
jgi:abelson tyrosine-protein kinase 1